MINKINCNKLLLQIVFIGIMFGCKPSAEVYVCPPCDQLCDELTFDKSGKCPHCGMHLVEGKPDDQAFQNLNNLVIKSGSGKFIVSSGKDSSKVIGVHYYQPKNMSLQAPVTIVLPGAGRNAAAYRNAWIPSSDRQGNLVLALEFHELFYPEFWNYNLAGMIKEVNVEEETFTIVSDSSNWLFGDIDKLFEQVKSLLSLTAETYDIFGHSAGGQILHRMAIFYPENSANRILAANSGWYTLPSDSVDFPYGLRNQNQSEETIDFSSKLIVMLGENDDASETRGHLRHTPETDAQGLHRLSRGIFFYNFTKRIAESTDLPFAWKLEVIPDVGHDYAAMSSAAADLLYGSVE